MKWIMCALENIVLTLCGKKIISLYQALLLFPVFWSHFIDPTDIFLFFSAAMTPAGYRGGLYISLV